MGATPDKALEDFRLSRLPSPPAILARLLELCAGEGGDFDQLVELIGKDASLSAKVVALANSPLYAGGGVDSLKRALVTLGLGAVKSLALTAAVYQFYSSSDGIDGARLERFWCHAYTSGVLCRSLAKLTDYPEPEEAYLAGLLHDIGRLLLALAEPEAELGDGEGRALAAREHNHFCVGHDDLGARALEAWGLNPFIADAARFHHESAEALRDAHPLVRLVHIAGLLAAAEGAEEGELARAAGLFGLTVALLEDLRGRAEQEVSAAGGLLGAEGVASRPASDDPLAPRLRDHALLNAVRDQLAAEINEQAVVGAVLRGAALLFDVGALLLFDFELAANRLRGRAGLGQNTRLNELALPLEEGRSLLGQALLNGAPLHEEPPVSVLDRQLARLLKSPGLYAVPLRATGDPVGVLAFGVTAAQAARLEEVRPLLEGFAAEVAGHWSEWRRRRLEEQAGRNEATEFYRAHARRVAHEANNPLTILRNYMALLGAKLGDEHAARDDLAILREEIDRVASIIATLPEGPDGVVGEPGAVELNRLVRDQARLLEGSLLTGRPVTLELALDESIPPLALAPNPIKQILLNLSKNAVEAMEEGGRLRLASRDYVYFDGEPCVELSVEDDGPGLPPQVLANLFRPVATRKGGNHAGLGLSIVKNLVEELGGRIGCRGGEGGGTRFEILLPRRLAE